jgi:DNA-directed RNA polymerase specialized sigma24 family protein
MPYLDTKPKRNDTVNQYATDDDFCKVFREELDSLYQLSFLMTGDHENAERCLLAGLEDCYRSNHVFRDSALSWARYTIIRNGIRELQPRPNGNRSRQAETALPSRGNLPYFLDDYFKTEAVLALEDIERVVFVISVLERYLDHDCAILLGCSLPEIRQARTRAILHIMVSGQPVSRRSGEEAVALMSST